MMFGLTSPLPTTWGRTGADSPALAALRHDGTAVGVGRTCRVRMGHQQGKGIAVSASAAVTSGIATAPNEVIQANTLVRG